MKKRLLIFASIILLCFTMLTTKSNADEILQPVNDVYKPGIYVLDPKDNGEYNLTYEFIKKNEKSAIIVLDENLDISYKNINCNRRCNAGTITNKSTIIIIGGDISLYFSKLS